MADDEPERTPDGRYLIIDGRRWRASDPRLPESAARSSSQSSWQRAVP